MAGALTLYTPGARARYELAKMPGVAEALNPAERLVFRASLARPFSTYERAELLMALAEPIRFVMMDVGVKAGDESEQSYRLTRVAEVVSRYYGLLSIEDFKAAFELLVMGELDRYLPRRDGAADRSHYGVFNTEYVCKVLNAYVRYRARVMDAAEKLRPKEVQRDREAERGVRRALWLDFLSYKYRGRMPYMGAATVVVYYKIFARLGWVDASLAELSPEEQESVLLSAAASLGGGSVREDIRTAWKRREIERAFRELAEDEVQLNKFIGV